MISFGRNVDELKSGMDKVNRGTVYKGETIEKNENKSRVEMYL